MVDTALGPRRRAGRVTGTVRAGRVTKEVLRRARPGDVLIVSHRDLDGLAADGIIRAGAGAVINTCPSISGRYPAQGALRLFEASIPVLDVAPGPWQRRLREGETVTVDPATGCVFHQGRCVAVGRAWSRERIDAALAAARANLRVELDHFLDNTLAHARREKELLTRRPDLPPLRAALAGRHVLVVARGDGYREDLRTILHYVREQRPVLVGVDGGADALLDAGLRVDIVIGDMDSVSDEALAAAGQRIVHAFPDGSAPGLARVRDLGLDAEIFKVRGTSEDAALLLAYEAGADLIVAVGTHSHVIDFLEKGRPGMASTLLTRLKVGSRLVDAKGVRLLYRSGSSSYMPHLAAAGLLAAAAVTLASPLTRGLLRLALLELRYVLGW